VNTAAQSPRAQSPGLPGTASVRSTIKAVAVAPGKPNTIHLRDVPKPQVDDVPAGRGVLIKILRVGVDGTDNEINAAEYGAAPAGDDYLIIGHESFGRVEAVGPNVSEFKRNRRLRG
jgi:glucose 1-dehydrogenase